MYEFNNLSSSNLSNNYYSSKIKEGIPIFQEQNGGSLSANNFVDPFKLLENEKRNNLMNLGRNNLNMNISQSQIRNDFENITIG